MDFTFNEEQSLIQDQVDQFVQKEYDWETRQSLSNSELVCKTIGKNLLNLAG